MVNVARIFSTLGNPDSLIPLAIKDTASTAGMTAGSYITGKEEGHDRFIDEVGTEIIWLGGLPFFKWLYDKTLFKSFNLDSKFDARNLKDNDIFSKIKEFAPTEEIKNNLDNISKNQNLFKKIAKGKFFVSTSLAVGSYIGLTKFKQYYTDKKIRNNLIQEYQQNLNTQNNNKQNSTNITFKSLASKLESYAFSPVKNMWVLDGCITTERLADSRSKQEFIGYTIKEGSLLFFMYYAGKEIQKIFENFVEKKHNLSIDLNSKVLENNYLSNSFKDKSITKSLQEFKNANKSNVDLYEFLHKNPDNIIVKTLKDSDIIKMYEKPQGFLKKSIVTDKIDTRKYIDLNTTNEIYNKIEKLYKQYEQALNNGMSHNDFFKKIVKLKRIAVINNIGSSILALGVLTPAIMLLQRISSKDNQEFETKKRIRNELIKEGIIKDLET